MKFLSALVLLGSMALPVLGGTLYVPAQYPTINDALLAAQNGDSIRVSAGTYYERLIIDKAVVLIGEDKKNTIIDGGGKGNAASISHDNVKIMRFTLRKASWGVGLLTVDNVSLLDNIITSCQIGIFMYDSSRIVVQGNRLANHSLHGILTNQYAGTNSHIHVRDNTFVGNDISVKLNDLDHSMITGNEIHTSVMQKKGIFLSDVKNTFVLRNHLRDQNTGMDIKNGANLVIAGNDLDDMTVGMNFYNISKSHITRNKIQAEYRCIILNYSQDTSISRNGMSQAVIGLDGGPYMGTGVKVLNNTILECEKGIKLDSAESTEISENTIKDCILKGVTLYHPDQSSILNNHVHNCGERGFELSYATDCTFKGNTVSKSTGEGLYLEGSFNLIYNNNFKFNGQNVLVGGYNFNNQWDNGYSEGGNFWSDYRGVDQNGDGYGDTPYCLPGVRDKDYFPLMQPY